MAKRNRRQVAEVNAANTEEMENQKSDVDTTEVNAEEQDGNLTVPNTTETTEPEETVEDTPVVGSVGGGDLTTDDLSDLPEGADFLEPKVVEPELATEPDPVWENDAPMEEPGSHYGSLASGETPLVFSEDIPSLDEVNKTVETELSKDVNLGAIRGKLSPSGQSCLSNIEDYMRKMDPKIINMSEKDMANHQVSLAYTLQIILNRLDDSDFYVLWGVLLALFNEHKDGVFRDDLVNRVPDHVQLSDADHAAFYRTLNLLLVTRDPSNRKEKAQFISWDYTCQYGYTEDARNRVVGFYDV